MWIQIHVGFRAFAFLNLVKTIEATRAHVLKPKLIALLSLH
jgi:hypothetical protein